MTLETILANRLTSRLLGTTAALALTLGATTAFAQVDDSDVENDLAATPSVAPGAIVDTPADEIIVTGVRAAIAESLAIKRNASSIVEAISAEDIGKLPDLSIADSLARLPGVTAQRVRGRAQGISIRGLGPDFSIALLNGREIVSAGNNRGIEFDQFPSELIGTGIVYKTPTARLSSTGLAGTVDLITVKPLDYSESQVNVAGRYVLNDNGQLNPDFSDDGYRLFGSYIAVNDSQTAGITLAVTRQSNPTQFFSRELKSEFPFQVAQTDDGVTYAADNPRTGVVSRDFQRTSIAGSLQFEPNDRFRASADVLYNDYEDEGIFRGVETPLASWSGNGLTAVSGASGQFADSATYGLTPVILRTDTESNEVQTSAFGVNVAYDLTENLTVMADFATSSLDRNDIDYESYAGTGRGIVGSGDEDRLSALTYTTPDNGEYSISDGRNIDYTDPGTVLLTDPGGWGQVGFVREPIVEDDLDEIRLEASYGLDTPFVSKVLGGVIFNEREKTFTDDPFFLRPGQGFVDSSQPIPGGAIVGQTDAGSTGLPIIAYDPSDLRRNGTYISEAATPNQFQVEEQIETYYAMVELDAQLGSIPLTGNIGVQYVDVEQGSTGTVPTASGQALSTVGDSYGDWLPSVNLNFEVMDRTNLRLGYSKTVTRPLFNDLAANFGFGPDTSRVCPDTNADGIPDTLAVPIAAPNDICFGGGGGNPLLRPYAADAYDISLGKYFGASSGIVIAGFYKDLSDYIQNEQDFIDGSELIRGFGAGDFLDANPSVALTRFDGPVNTRSGEIYGIEGTINLALDDFMSGGFAEGFGFNGSYGYTDATVERVFNGETLETAIPGYSEQVGNGEIYYENFGLQARVSASYRSGYQANVFLFDGSAFGARAVGRTTVDAKLGYEFQDGGLNGLYLGVEGYNLTDEPFRTEVGFNEAGDQFISRREDYGRQFNLIVSKKF